MVCCELGNSVDGLKVVFQISYLIYYDPPLKLLKSESKTIRTLVAEEIYYGLIFPQAKKCRTLHNELTTYLLSAQTE